ncbi:hypothetical protein HMP09_0549 [Sphingomonas sp. HMP9]|uniref:hypothetical protein n=1 Tax=Sphingomonas sp. HMP9 TaxID=1517554 RepID=UPI0015966524|nr:hypothetical protein [Sphingomonas sp. HMP9]BCA61315.1 hypothetical protein HMP09_0549 [Sphingomonas sp. HMP9]
MSTATADQRCLRTQLLRRLAGLGVPAGTYGSVPHGADSGVRVFGYCIQERERIARARMEHPVVVVVLIFTES